MESVPEESFKYANLDKQTRNVIWQYTSEIKDLMRLTAENIISIGQKLTLVKSQLGHGSFQKWLRTEFEWSEQTARQFMQVYRWSETIENKNFVFSELGTSALYLLAAPSTPPKAREEILDLVDGGEKVSYTRAKNIVSRYKESPSFDDNLAKEIDTEIKPRTVGQFADTSNLLFRLQTSEFSCIVKLYHTYELEAVSSLTVGAIVKIKIGRWQGHTAKIIEVLNEQQLIMTERQETTDLVQTASLPRDTDISVSVLDEVNFGDLQNIREMGQHLIISYGNICLAVRANPRTLTTFTEQIRTDPEFIKHIMQQALDR